MTKKPKPTKAPPPLTGSTGPELAALRVIAASEDVAQLRRFQENARRAGSDAVGRAASRRLIDLLPARATAGLDDDFRRTTLAFEELVLQGGGKPARPARRPKAGAADVRQALIDAAAAAPTAGFAALLDRGLPEMTAEAVILRHRAEFPPEVIAAATRRLSDAGVDVAALPAA